jgi:predicted kinase
MLGDNEDYFAHEEEVFETWITQIKRALKSDTECIYVDATHLSETARNKVLNRLDLNGVSIIPVSFEVSLERCLNQNAKRTGRARVPEDVIRNMHKVYKAPSMDEKYEYIGIIKVGENDL